MILHNLELFLAIEQIYDLAAVDFEERHRENGRLAVLLRNLEHVYNSGFRRRVNGESLAGTGLPVSEKGNGGFFKN